MIIEDSRRGHGFLLLRPALQLESRVQIDHELQLQAVIKSRQVKFRVSGLIIHHFHENLFLIFTVIDAVNPAF